MLSDIPALLGGQSLIGFVGKMATTATHSNLDDYLTLALRTAFFGALTLFISSVGLWIRRWIERGESVVSSTPRAGSDDARFISYRLYRLDRSILSMDHGLDCSRSSSTITDQELRPRYHISWTSPGRD